jgi:hypothetical protein
MIHNKSISQIYIRGAVKVRMFARRSIRQDFGDFPMNIGQTLSGAISEFWDMH